MSRVDKINYYLDMAETVLKRATCLRRNYGCVIVKNDEIISTGYNGAPRGRINCSDLGYCARDVLKIKSGENYELCRSVHSEQNAIISAARKDMIGAFLYMVGKDVKTGNILEHIDSCLMCKRVIINAGIKEVIVRDINSDLGYKIYNVEDWIKYDEVLEEKVNKIVMGSEKQCH
ncbi:MAG: deaminase [Clostridia bacterium]